MPQFKVNSASPSHPRRLTGRLCFPSSHNGWSCVGFGVRYNPHRLKQLFRSHINVRGITASPTACTILCVRFVQSADQYSINFSDATLDTGGWLTLTRQGLAPCKTHQASPGALTPRITGQKPPLTGRTNVIAHQKPDSGQFT